MIHTTLSQNPDCEVRFLFACICIHILSVYTVLLYLSTIAFGGVVSIIRNLYIFNFFISHLSFCHLSLFK